MPGSRPGSRGTTPKGKEREVLPEHPGAGTLYVHKSYTEFGSSSLGSKRKDGLGEIFDWDEIAKTRNEPCMVASPDSLLQRGVEGYTYLPRGVLGKGKFSTVYKVIGPDSQPYALKHTPLHPHHPLISARLLREPTLLAQLPPHPCLIGVEALIRTEGHFYLIEQYATHHVPLPDHPLPLSPGRAAKILDQLVSVLRDCLHEGRVCHRDLKGENVLVDIDTGEILLIDLGLATQFSGSEAKLTTCCGSPAFHSPEIVNALARPPGEVTYYGPELDIWCIALTLLSLLSQTRFPLGPAHTSLTTMHQRVLDRLQELDKLYPPHQPWRAITNASSRLTLSEREHETREWTRVRRAMRDFLDIDGLRRMEAFRLYDIGQDMRRRVEDHQRDHKVGTFKSTSFLREDIKFALALHLEYNHDADDASPLVLSNPSGESERRVTSYVKYVLRSHGILYHCLPDTSPLILQLVLPLPTIVPTPPSPPMDKPEGWISGLFKRSSSVPPPKSDKPPITPSKKQKERYLTCHLRIQFEGETPKRAAMSRASSRVRRNSTSHNDTSMIASGAMAALTTLVEAQHMDLDTQVKRSGDQPRPSTKRATSHARPPLSRGSTSNRTVSLNRATSYKSPHPHPHPLSRQVSTESVPITRSGSGSGVSRNPSIKSKRRDTVPKIIVTVSDARAYPVIRKALDVKLGNENGLQSPIVVGRELPSLLYDSTSTDTSPDVSREKDGMVEERGRRRSKEDKVVIEVMGHKGEREGEDEGPLTPPIEKGESRERSRGRRKKGGFLEGIFGRDKSGSRSSSRSGGGSRSRSRRGSRSLSTPPPTIWSGSSLYTPVGM